MKNLSHWLEVAKPLSTEYKTFKYTAAPIHGDPSKIIFKGKIVAKKKKYDIELSPETESQLFETCHNAKKLNNTHCAHIAEV